MEIKLKSYCVRVSMEDYLIIAEEVISHSDALKFMIDGEIVAYFQTWDNWRLIKDSRHV